uniref:Pre-rRNA-processing protein TSR1 homolog n=1 Tax=Lutzomyia longipalpis TaxID=7200 RepID=A0A7G3AT92_LUTLO
MSNTQQRHRHGSLKQTNKPHKTGRHRSKSAVENANKGKTSVKALSRKMDKVMSRDSRRQQANQLRKNKRAETMNKKRQLGTAEYAPFLVCLLPLEASIDPRSTLDMLEKCDPEAIVYKNSTGITYLSVPRFKQRFSFIVPPVGRGNEFTALDYLKVADTTLFIVSANNPEGEIMDKWGARIFQMALAQGLPTPIVALQDLESIAPKKRIPMKSGIQKVIEKMLPDQKLLSLDTNSDALNLLRKIGAQKKTKLRNRMYRPHLYADRVEYEEEVLKVTGYLRGTPLDVNRLVYIPGLGDFQMAQIDVITDPYPIDKRNLDQEIVRKVFAVADERQTPLDRENAVDDVMQEEEEEAVEEETEKPKKLVKRVPVGMNSYTAAWIPDVEEVEEDEESEDESDDDDEDFMSCASEVDSNAEMDDDGSQNDDQEYEEITEEEGISNEAKYDEGMDLEEEKRSLDKLKAAQLDKRWPDEIDTPQDIPVRLRYQKYRGLESFRTSPWDTEKGLPSDYSRIFHFENFRNRARFELKEAEAVVGVPAGLFLTIHIKGVNRDIWDAFKSGQESENFIIYGLLPHEHKMSIVNCILRRTPDSEMPIESKERLIIQCGYRRFLANPIYSEHTHGNKYKFEKFFRPDEVVVASFYAPIQYPPAAVMCFRQNPDSSVSLVAAGSLLSCDPNRIILKRIRLSGYPLKILKDLAVVRFMFFNAEDVNYYKPIQLRTRCGRLGHIKESLGTHGHMKCRFDGQLKSQDTVYLQLYKRVFPKWTYQECLKTAIPRQGGVNRDIWDAFKSGQESENFIIYGLLPHEHKMSIVNCILRRTPDSEMPIESKERLIIQCGYRRFLANPIYSEHTHGNKYKFEKFFRPDEVVVASFYAPIQYPPAAVMCFRQNPDSSVSLVAAGSLLSCDPNRIILKRIRLSGYPLKILKDLAVVRFMFFNAEDVNYYKPIQLRTRCGRLGHIKESLGTHGHMKCRFDGQLKSQDTVYLQLYKRVFPKWTYQECLKTAIPRQGVSGSGSMDID